MSKKRLAGIIVGCVVVVIVAIVLFIFRPWEATPPAETYTLTTAVNPSGAGSISPSGGEYEPGDQVLLTASPTSGYIFYYWSGDASGSTPAITITMDSDKSLIANFQTIPTVPGVLFSDDFSDESGVWDTYSFEDSSVLYSNGWLHLINYSSATFATNTYAHQNFTDFILEVETRLVAGTDDNWHLVACRAQYYENNYEFGISANGYYTIVKRLGGWKTIEIKPTWSYYIHQGQGVTNLIHIECIGKSLSLSVNGHLLEEIIDPSFGGGDIALGASCVGAGFTEIAFDNIVVSEA